MNAFLRFFGLFLMICCQLNTAFSIELTKQDTTKKGAYYFVSNRNSTGTMGLHHV